MGKPHWQEVRAPYSWSMIFGKKSVQWHQSWNETQADLRDINSLLHQTCWTSWTSICSPGLLTGAQQHTHWHVCRLWSYVYVRVFGEIGNGRMARCYQKTSSIGIKSGVFCWCSKTFLLSECSVWTRRSCSAAITATSRWSYIKSIVITLATVTRII